MNQLPAMLLLLLCGVAGVVAFTNSTYQPDSQHNSSGAQLNKLNRSKRVAIFNGQGVIKFVPSFAYPVKQADKQQSFWWFFNFQAQYIPTNIPLYWWSFWNTTAFVSTAREWRKDLQTTLRDDARIWIYDAIEATMERMTGSERGSSCLLRAICEISQLPFEKHHIFGELLNAVMVPTLDNVGEKYLNARDAGRAGADCTHTYDDCSVKLWSWITQATKITSDVGRDRNWF